MRSVSRQLRSLLHQQGVLARVRRPAAGMFAVGIAVIVLVHVRGGRWGFSEDQVELAGLVVAGLGWLIYIWARRAAEIEVLRQLDISGSQLRLLATQTPADVWTTDAELRLTSVFGTLVARLEAPGARVPGRTLYEVFETRDAAHPVIAAHLQALRGETATYERVSGDLVLSGCVKPLRDERGLVIGCIGTAMDVSGWLWAERQLRRLGALVESAQDAIVSTDLNGVVDSWNGAAERLYGYRRDEMIGRPISVLEPPDRPGEAAAIRERLMRGDLPPQYDTVRQRSDGTVVPVSAHLSPILDADGKLTGISAIYRDMTDRKRAETALRVSEERFRVALKDSAISVGTLDRELRYTWVYNTRHGFRPEDVLGKRPDELIGVNEAEGMVELLREVLSSGAGRRREITGQTRGERWTYDQMVEPLRDDRGEVTGLTLVAIDITERKRAEETRERLAALVESSVDTIISATSDGTILTWNRAAERMFGYTAQEAIGKSISITFPPERAEEMQRNIRTFNRGQSVGPYETERVRSDGRVISVAVSLSPIRDGSGRVVGASGILRDITERKRGEEALLRSQKELRALARRLQSVREEEHTRMARDIHDELGQALTALRLDLSWLGKKLPEAGAAVQRRIGAMVALTDDTIEAGRRIVAELRPPILDDLGLAPSLEWYVQHFAKRAGLRYEWDPGPAELAVDRELAVIAYRIVQEALTNVARHAQAKHVAVRLGGKDGALTLEIRDDGRGISEDAVTSPRSLGIVGMRERALVRGGSLAVCRLPGGGTSVRVTIPAERRREPRARE